jgi:hypothetical protein
VTSILLLPLLLWSIFRDDGLIPRKLTLATFGEEMRRLGAIKPEIPYATRAREALERFPGWLGWTDEYLEHQLILEQVMNPFIDKASALFGTLMLAGLPASLLALNASQKANRVYPPLWGTLPFAAAMLCWDLGSGWLHRKKSQAIAWQGRQNAKEARQMREVDGEGGTLSGVDAEDHSINNRVEYSNCGEGQLELGETHEVLQKSPSTAISNTPGKSPNQRRVVEESQQRSTLASWTTESRFILQATFPTATAVIMRLPYRLVPFTLAMSVLVESLVSRGWVAVFAHGWDRWAAKTGTVGAISGMGFLAVILSNVSPREASHMNKD